MLGYCCWFGLLSPQVKTGIVLNIIGVFCVTLAINTWGKLLFELDTFPTWANSTTSQWAVKNSCVKQIKDLNTTPYCLNPYVESHHFRSSVRGLLPSRSCTSGTNQLTFILVVLEPKVLCNYGTLRGVCVDHKYDQVICCTFSQDQDLDFIEL